MRNVVEHIYRAHRQGLFTLALSVTRSAERAEDAVQTAFERLWRRPRRLTGDRVAYVYRAVRNAALDQMRRARSRPVEVTLGGGESIFDGRPSPPHRAMAAEDEALLRDAVEALPDAQREVIVMRVYGGLTFEQVAEAVGDPLPTVASRYRRGLDALRQKLEGRR